MYTIPEFAGPSSGFNSAGPVEAGQFDFGSLGGMSSTQNQYMGFPAMSSSGTGGASAGAPDMFSTTDPGAISPATPPGIVPPSDPFSPGASGGFDVSTAGVGARLPGQVYQSRTIDPNFTSMLDQWLRSQLGKGATPFDLSAILPSTGEATAPGTLSAPDNPILKSLEEFYTKGTGGPLPGVLPMWTSALKAMDIPIQKQLANIKEQFGARGALGSSEMGTALETFGAQTAADQEALLGQLTLQALPGMEAAGAEQQQIDQASIDKMVQEFIRTRPEYSPLLGEEFGFGTMYPPTYANKKGTFGENFLGGLGSGLAGLITGGN